MQMTMIHVALVAVLAGCGGADKGEPAAPAAGDKSAQPVAADDPSCPVAVPGTSVAVESAEGGAALVFATTGDVAEVRRRASEMARIHNEEHAKMGPLPTGGDAAGHDHASHDHGAMQSQEGEHAGHGAGGAGEHTGHAGGMIQTHSHAQVEDTDSGARIVFHVDASQMSAIESELRQHAQHLGSGRCTM